MAAVEIKMSNYSDLVKNATEEEIQKALEAIGLLAEGYAKKLCAVDTGRLRNSISHTVKGDTAYIGTNVFYAPYVEMGTSKMAAQPFLRPAVTRHQKEYMQVAADILTGGEE